MTLIQLDYALAVLRTGSIVGAAEICRVTQPTLTQQLRKLEVEMGGTLFNRGRHPLRPTALGRRVLVQAARVRVEAGRLEGMADGEGGDGLRGPLRLGVIPSVAGSLLPRVIPAFLKRRPGVALRVVEHQTRDLLRLLLDGELDAGIAAVPLEARGLDVRVLYHEGFVAYLPPGHSLLARKSVDPSALVDLPLLLMGEGHCFRHQVLSLCEAPPPAEGIFLESGSFQT
ncbi:MAG: LysR family transcriptional regulator, partial [bacterium]